MRSLRKNAVAVLARPAFVAVAVVIGGGLFLASTLYCAVYTHLTGSEVRLVNGARWALTQVLPWWAALALGWRFVEGVHTGRRFWTRVLVIVLGVLAVSLLLEQFVLFVPDHASAAVGLVRRLPAMILVTVLLGWRWAPPHPRGSTSDIADTKPETLPPPTAIDWVSAAGNYVEISTDGRTVLLRMTMRQAEAALGTRGFLRIHRSTLLRVGAIKAYLPGKDADEVQLSNGPVFRVGESYRARVAKTLARAT